MTHVDLSADEQLKVDRVAFPEASDDDLKLMRSAEQYTMTSLQRRWALIAAVRYVCRRGIAGAFVEAGVWRGGSAMIAAQSFLGCDVSDREFWLYDTFEGMVRPSDLDVRLADGDPAMKMWLDSRTCEDRSDWCVASQEDVETTLALTTYPSQMYHLIRGRVEDTLIDRANLPGKIAILRLDTDWYQSTKLELDILYDRVSPGGVIIFDDYGYWSGAKKAVDDFFQSRNEAALLHRIDECCRVLIKF